MRTQFLAIDFCYMAKCNNVAFVIPDKADGEVDNSHGPLVFVNRHCVQKIHLIHTNTNVIA
jgi:hypothetical protein